MYVYVYIYICNDKVKTIYVCDHGDFLFLFPFPSSSPSSLPFDGEGKEREGRGKEREREIEREGKGGKGKRREATERKEEKENPRIQNPSVTASPWQQLFYVGPGVTLNSDLTVRAKKEREEGPGRKEKDKEGKRKRERKWTNTCVLPSSSGNTKNLPVGLRPLRGGSFSCGSFFWLDKQVLFYYGRGQWKILQTLRLPYPRNLAIFQVSHL